MGPLVNEPIEFTPAEALGEPDPADLEVDQ